MGINEDDEKTGHGRRARGQWPGVETEPSRGSTRALCAFPRHPLQDLGLRHPLLFRLPSAVSQPVLSLVRFLVRRRVHLTKLRALPTGQGGGSQFVLQEWKLRGGKERRPFRSWR